MQLDGARILVAGATGALGQGIAQTLVDRGAQVVPGGRDEARLKDIADRCDNPPVRFDAVDVDSCTRAVDEAAQTLSGLDAIVVACGVAAFGPAVEADPAVTEELFDVNVLGPMALVRAAARHLDDGGSVVVISAILADLPTLGMAEYSASKSALAAWLSVLRRELRRQKVSVLDVRPPHLDTGLQDRALAGDPPKLPEPYPAARVVEAVVAAMEEDKHEIVWSAESGDLEIR